MMPNTYKQVSIEITGKILPQTEANEEYIAVMKINQLLKTHTVRETAMIWNGSLGGNEKAVAKKGINKWHIAFNTVAYADSVINNLNK